MVLRKNIALGCALGFCTLVCSTAYGAYANNLNSYSLAEDDTHEEGKSVKGYIGGLYNGLTSEVSQVDGNRYNVDFEFDYFKKKPDELERRLTFAARLNDENLTMYSVQEAYINHKWGRSELIFGRQILDWSIVDGAWGFGKLNNRRNFDFFVPGQEGLVGIQLRRRYSNGLRYHFFVSPIYVPETNPGLDIDKGDKTIKSRNPWGNPPAETAEIPTGGGPNRVSKIEYIVDYPEINEVIWRPGAGLNIGWESTYWMLDAFFMRKPENQLTTKVEVSIPPAGEIRANITPEFYYHDLYGGNIRYRNKDLEIYFSGLAIRPNTFPDGNSDALQYTEIKTAKIREDYVGGGITQSNDQFVMGLSYVARLSPYNRNTDNLAQEPRWNQAGNGFFTWNWGRSFSIQFNGKYDMFTRDRLFMVKALYNVSRALQLNAGVNLIGTPPDGKSFWSPYTNNDAAYAGLRYLF